MFCNAVVYEGNEPYIFVSYAVQDVAVVGPVLDQLGYDGYRIWFDEEGTTKNAVSSAMIEKVRYCSVFLVLITNGYAASHVCRSALSVAVESGRTVRTLILQDVLLPHSLQLQLVSSGCSMKFEAISHALLIKKLYADRAVQSCHASGRSFYARKKKNIFDLVKASRCEESTEKPNPEEEPQIPPEIKPEKPVVIPEEKPEPEVFVKEKNEIKIPEDLPKDDETILEQSNDEETVLYDPDDNDDGDDDEEQTSLIKAEEVSGLLFRLADETAYRISEPLTQLGRSARKADIVLAGNTYIGNHHADLVFYRGNFYLRAVKASNGTFMNGERIENDEQRQLDDSARFQLADEEFLFVSGSMEMRIRERGNFVLLKNTSTQEMYLLTENELFLDRNHIWPGGTLDDATVSHKHARLYAEGNEWYLTDNGSKNGTSVNRKEKLKAGDKEILGDNASVRLGSTVLQVRILTLEKMLLRGKDGVAEA